MRNVLTTIKNTKFNFYYNFSKGAILILPYYKKLSNPLKIGDILIHFY